MRSQETKTRVTPPRKFLGILICFFLSGLAGLIYEVAWAKALGQVFGHTTYAVATVLAVFMGGLAGGSAYFGKWAENRPNSLASYARIEFLVAAAAALSLVGLGAVRSFYVAAYPHFGGSQPLLLALRFLGSAVVLLVPTFLMGGTLPILISGVARNSAELGIRVSQLYWVNTLGAVVGTLVCGFYLLPGVGLRLTIVSAVAINIFVGTIAHRISKVTQVAPSVPLKEVCAPREYSQSRPHFLLWLFGIVGFTAFAYEIAWTRQLAITMGSSTYAFTLIVATFLTGTVLGSALFQRFLRGSARVSTRTFSRTQLGAGIAGLSSLFLYHWIPAVIQPLLRATDQVFSGLVLAQLSAAALTLLPVATILGFNFPLVIVLVHPSPRSSIGVSRTVGVAYAANTAGAILGSVVTGFWLLSWLGSFRVIVFAAVVNVLLALVLDLRRHRHALPLGFDLCVLATAALVVSSPFLNNRLLLSFSPVLYGNSYQGRLTLGEMAATRDLVFAAEGVNDSVVVVRTDNSVALRVNGKVDASTDDARTQLLLGHLGAAFHPAPRRVLIIGFGSGMTASAVARYPDVEKIDCVEIEPAVVRAAPYLQSLNRNVLKDRRIHLIFEDARNFLLTTGENYDLIISEPSNPWIAGVATLFTDEYYAAARDRLAPGGVVVQWVQAYSIEPDDLRMVIATFSPHFSDVTLWRAGETDLLLVGRATATPLGFSHLRSLWKNPALRSDFDIIDVHQPEGLVAYFLLDDGAVRKLGEGGKLNTDNLTLLEYHAPRSLLDRNSIAADEELINELRNGPLPENLDPRETERALEGGAVTALDLNDVTGAKKFVGALELQPDSAARYTARGRLGLLEGDLPKAKSSLELAHGFDPDSLEIMHWLAEAEHRSGDDISAQAHLDDILKRNPRFLPALSDRMQFAIDRQDYRLALLAQLARVTVMTDVPAFEYCRLGAMWIKESKLSEAESALVKGLLKDPYSYSCHVGLGEVYGLTGRLAQARQNFEWVVRFFPTEDASIYKSLAGICFALGDPKSARAALRNGRRLFPDNIDLHKSESLVVP